MMIMMIVDVGRYIASSNRCSKVWYRDRRLGTVRMMMMMLRVPLRMRMYTKQRERTIQRRRRKRKIRALVKFERRDTSWIVRRIPMWTWRKKE
jgi:hypothetical protein